MRKENQSQPAPRQGSHTQNLPAPLKHAAPNTSSHNQNGNNPYEAPSLTHSGTLRHIETGNVLCFSNKFYHVKHFSSGLGRAPCQAGERLFPQKFKCLFRYQPSIQGTHGRRTVKSALCSRMKKTLEEEEKKWKRWKMQILLKSQIGMEDYRVQHAHIQTLCPKSKPRD